jgi:hypothetical protein
MIPIYVFAGGEAFTVDYLVVAGGGGGGSRAGGGGGAGGYISSVTGEQSGGPSSPVSRLNLFGGTPLTVTVGAGGAVFGQGGDSRFGSIISTGGGRGGRLPVTGTNGPTAGGSGGGTSQEVDETPGDGTENQGNAGGQGSGGGNFPNTFNSGGGGGASAVGVNNGGAGIASSITGTSIFRAGGGGGDRGAYESVFTGGNGGGGNGALGDLRNPADPPATSGTANTGGGGGGGGGLGGSGVVILRYPSVVRIINRIDPGLTYTFSDDGTWKRYVFTAGTGNITF